MKSEIEVGDESYYVDFLCGYIWGFFECWVSGGVFIK